MRLRLLGAGILVVLLAGCGQAEPAAGLPSGEHVHSLGVTSDDGLLLGLHGGLYRSDDGVAWELAGLQGEDAMVIAAVADQPVFVAGHEVLYRSDDEGKTFTALRPADLPGLDIHAFSQAPSDGGSVYAYVVGHGLFWSGNAGESWELRAGMDRLPPDLSGLAVTGEGSETLLIAGPQNGIIRSTDGGRSLVRVAEVPAWAVAVEPDEPRVVWALTGSGLMGSGDGGETWDTVSTLPGVGGQPVALAAGNDVLWLVSEDPRSLYRSVDGGEVWEQIGES